MSKGSTPKQTKGETNVVQQVIVTPAASVAESAAETVLAPTNAGVGIMNQLAKSLGAKVEDFVVKIPERLGGWLSTWAGDKMKLIAVALLSSGGLGVTVYSVAGKEAPVTWIGVERGPASDSGNVCTPHYSNQEVDDLLRNPNKYGQRRQTWVVSRDGHHFSGFAKFDGSETKHEVNGSVPRSPTDANTQVTGGLLAWMRSPEGEATYNLKPSKADPNIFVGRQIAKDCDVGVVVSCAFILAPETKVASAESMMEMLKKGPEGLCVREPLL